VPEVRPHGDYGVVLAQLRRTDHLRVTMSRT
jgi:hypothetical protein